MSEHLLIRADGSPRIGTGHVMRCLALAEGWQRVGGKVVFALAESTPALHQRLCREGIEVLTLHVEPGGKADAMETAELIQQHGSGWAVVDGYHFGCDYQRILKDAGLSLLVVDDYGHAGHYWADIVLNQNLHASEDYYRNREDYTRLLLGADYVQLRGQFQKWMNWKREVQPIGRRILVTLGGSDPDNLTAKVIQAVQMVNENVVEATVVVGGSNQHYAALLKMTDSSSVPIRVERDTPCMDEWMAWADVAISSGGTTVWELAFMGLPAIIGQIGPAEEKLVSGLARQDLFTRLGWFRDVTPGQIAASLIGLLRDAKSRSDMSRKGRTLIDGRGTERVIALLKSGIGQTDKTVELGDDKSGR